MGKLVVVSTMVASTMAVALAAAGTASAAGLLGDAPGPNSWTGFYIGANAGYAWGNDAVTDSVVEPGGGSANLAAVNATGSPTFSPGSFVGGGEAGYNYQIGRAVFGFEADFQYMGLRGAAGLTSVYPTSKTSFNVNTEVSTNWLATARPRVGFAVTDRLMVYATGGLAVTDDRFGQTAGLGGPYTVASSSTNRIGGVVGAGMEWAVNQHWSAKAEYLYADFGKANTLGTLSPSFAGFEWYNSYNLTTSIGRVGVNYKF